MGNGQSPGTVAAAGGSIDVQSEEGKGTRFRIDLPAAPTEQAPAPPAPERARARRRVLVIDDESLLARALARILARDHDVEALTSAAPAADRIAAGERWDVILCDLLMPGMTGMDLAERVAQDAPGLLPRLVFITGGACTERSRLFLERGGFPSLEKPIEPRVLREAVEDVARRAE